MRALSILGLVLFAPPAMADDTLANATVEDDEEFDFLREAAENEALNPQKDEVSADDFAFDDEFSFDEAPPPAAADPFKVDGKQALAGNFKAQLITSTPGGVVIELPVLAAQTGDAADYWLVGRATVDGQVVAESRQLISGTTRLTDAPTMAWVKLHAPVVENSGVVQVSIARAESASDEGQTLFTQAVGY